MDREFLPAVLNAPAPARLAVADGAIFDGFTNAPGLATGEVVFNTSMFGYQEMLTDPSYCGQILVLTTPHVGVVGVNREDDESQRIWAEALIVSDCDFTPSNWRAQQGLRVRLGEGNVPVAWGFDTRALVLHLRAHGALPGVLVCGAKPQGDELAGLLAKAHGTDGCDLTRRVARQTQEHWDALPWLPPGKRWPAAAPGPHVVVIDCGVKHSILRQLRAAGAEVLIVPPDTGAAEILALDPDGVLVSNGPGDPAAVALIPQTIRELLVKKPILGICLGHQLLGLALGGRTYKLPFGHHGGNHPVRDLATGGVWITSQNHNYAVDPDSLPGHARVSMTNLTDGSVEGIICEDFGAFGIQFHPEAGPGPHDALGVFTRFVARCQQGGGIHAEAQ